MEINFKAKPISNDHATRLSNQLRKCVSADIICHKSSDEDALACAKALQWFLDKQKIVSRIISDNATDTFEINDKNFNIIDHKNSHKRLIMQFVWILALYLELV